MSIHVHIHQRDSLGRYEMEATIKELKSLKGRERERAIADLERRLRQAEQWLKGKRGPRRTGYQEEVDDLRKQLSAIKTMDADKSLLKRGAEYEGRFWYGAYSAARFNSRMLAPDSPMRAAILSARKTYNELRAQVGLPLVTEWEQRPLQTMERMLRDSE